MRQALRALMLFAAVIAAIASITGCNLLNGLRRDIDEEEMVDEGPTVGGRWVERGYLASDEYDRYRDRVPAAMDSARSLRQRGESLANRAQAEANRNDFYRGMDVEEEDLPENTYSNTPNLPPAVKRAYKNGMRATRADFLDESQNEGSLWAGDGQSNFFFSKNKVRGVGDLVTINMEQDLVRDVGLEMRRSLSPGEREVELKAAQERLDLEALKSGSDKVASSSAAPNRAPAADSSKGAPAETGLGGLSAPSAREATYADIDVGKSIELKAGDTMMGEILERYPNGNYKIRATKKIPYKNGVPRLVTLVGIAKGSDISEDDVVPSGKLYEYRVEAIR